MGQLDRVPGDADLYIGGLFTLKRKEALKQANITHVLSVLTLPLDDTLFDGYKHLAIDIDDDDDKDIIQHFPASNAFIQEGLDRGGGFMEQLNLYHRMRCPPDVASHPQYQRWLWEREMQHSLELKKVPGSEFIVFEDETPASEGTAASETQGGELLEDKETGDATEQYRCRRCRTSLGNSTALVSHAPRDSPATGRHCAHLFLQPLSWMRPILSLGNLEGRLECPNAKCKQNVGKYAWQGMKCSCGEWVVPGISVARGKVDIVSQMPAMK
ncbi:MAG: hypothetical protein Q9220_004043 [cf. Caloplaca sp. 1 TL-2023]